MREVEFSCEDLQGDVGNKERQIKSQAETIQELKIELATLKEQKTFANKEVRNYVQVIILHTVVFPIFNIFVYGSYRF